MDEPSTSDASAAVRTRRLVIVLLLAVMCTITLAPHVRLYVEQERRQAQLRERIAESEAAVLALEREQGLWNDDAYVSAQARERLHYVYPGETGYVVPPALLVTESDAVIGDGEGSSGAPAAADDVPWYRSLWAGLAESSPSPSSSPTAEPVG